MTRREFCGTVAASFSTDHMAEEDCPTCHWLVAGGLQCIACGRMVAAAHGDPVFDLGTQQIVGNPTVHTLPYDFPPLLRVKGKLVRAAQIEMWM